MHLLPVLLALAALFLAAPAAHAGWYGGEVIDTGVTSFGLDLERDGAGAVVYLKGGQVLLSRKADGLWTAPEPVGGGASDAAVAVGRDHRLAVAFVAGDTLYGAVAPGGDTPQPLGAPVALGSGGGIGSLAMDMGVNGHAYVVYTTALGDVRAVRLDSATTWTAVAEPLDIDPLRDAGRGSDRPRVATGADGHAIVAWGEGGRVWERRLIKTRLSAVPQEAGEGTLPEIDVEDDSSFVPVAWRSPGGGLVRRLVGSAFEAPWAFGAGTGGADVAIDGRGMGYAVAATGAGEVLGLPIDDEDAGPPMRLDATGAASAPVTAVGELGEIVAAWVAGSEVRGRAGDRDEDVPFAPEAVISRGDLPAAGAPALASDLTGNAIAGFLQGDALVLADHDQPPGKPSGGTTELWRPRARPEFRWRAGIEPWGAQAFAVFVDGVQVAAASSPADRVRPKMRIPDGEHTWFVQASDRRGQVSASDPRTLRVDVTKPVPRLVFKGLRRAGAPVRIVVKAKDATSGVARTRLTFPDGSVSFERSLRRSFPRGRHSIRLGVRDEAGNVARKRFELRIR